MPPPVFVKRPYPQACHCWNCAKPETVTVPSVSALPCFIYPQGTYVVGAADNADIDGSDLIYWIEATNSFTSIFGAEGYENTRKCMWRWDFKTRFRWACVNNPDPDPYTWENALPDFPANSTGLGQGGICIIDTQARYNATSGLHDSEYMVWLHFCGVYLEWSEDPTKRIRVVIYRTITCMRCWSGYNGSTVQDCMVFRIDLADVYEVDDLNCDDLPATINHSSRVISTRIFHYDYGGTGWTDSAATSVDYGWNPATSAYDMYTFTVPSPDSNVELTYA